MIATAHEIQNLSNFSRRLTEGLLQAPGASILRLTTARNEKGKRCVQQIQRTNSVESDVLHIFNKTAFDALCQTLGSVAEEWGEGTWVVGLGSQPYSVEDKKRCLALARATSSSMRVWTVGKISARSPNVELLPLISSRLHAYRVLFFSNEKHLAAFVCKETQAFDASEQKSDARAYMGFFTLNPFLVQSLQRTWSLAVSGLEPMVKLWEQEYNAPTFPAHSLQALKKEATETTASQALPTRQAVPNSSARVLRVRARGDKTNEKRESRPRTSDAPAHAPEQEHGTGRLNSMRSSRRANFPPTRAPRVVRVSRRRKVDPDLLA